MTIAIEVKHLKKSYGDYTAIKNLSLTVHKGEVFALLGGNGAGKTSLLECIQGLRTFESGTVEVTGKIGVQLQSASLPAHISTREAIALFSKWSGVNVNQTRVDAYGLKPFENKKYGALSTGQKRRLHLAMATIGNPDVIFLDEPTAGLDVEGRASLHEVIRALKQEGKTIIMASHDMAEVESLCDRLAIIKKGDIAFLGTPNALTSANAGESQVFVKLTKALEPAKFKFAAYEGLEQGYLVFQTAQMGRGLGEILNWVHANGAEVADLKIERVSLEEKFMEINKGEIV